MKPGKDAAKKPHLGKGQSWETFDRQMGPWLSTNGGAGVGMAWLRRRSRAASYATAFQEEAGQETQKGAFKLMGYIERTWP